MTRTDRRAAARLLVTCAVAAVALTGCGSSPVRAGAAAVVGNGRITTEQLAKDVDTGLADPAAAQLASDRPAYQRDVLSRLIIGNIIDAAAQRRGVTVTQGEVDASYAALEASLGGAEQLTAQAAAAGLTPDRVRELARTRALSDALGAALTPDAAQRDAAVQQVLTETAASLHIKINPRFGAWDGTQLTVVAADPTGDREVSTPEAPAPGVDPGDGTAPQP